MSVAAIHRCSQLKHKRIQRLIVGRRALYVSCKRCHVAQPATLIQSPSLVALPRNGLPAAAAAALHADAQDTETTAKGLKLSLGLPKAQACWMQYRIAWPWL